MAFLLTVAVLLAACSLSGTRSPILEASVEEIQQAFRSGSLTSREIVGFYLDRIVHLNPTLNGVIQLNPDALALADEADAQRRQSSAVAQGLHGIPVLLKDSIATADRMGTTAGSLALLGSKVPRDAGIVARLRRAGAIILGKTNLSEWMNFRSTNSTSGWSALGGQTKNPYNLDESPCGSSSGSAVAVAANMVSVSVGTETDGSILCPSSVNAVVGIKPTVGLTSRAGVIPISHTQDTVGPMCRSVADAVAVLDAIAGADPRDRQTLFISKYIPRGGYKQFLRRDGLRGKRLGIAPVPFFQGIREDEIAAVDKMISIAKSRGAVIVENLTLPHADEILSGVSEDLVLRTNFKVELNQYLAQLVKSQVRSLEDVIKFNIQHADKEMKLFGQEIFLESQATKGTHSKDYKEAVKRNQFLTKHGIDHLFETHKLDALIGAMPSLMTAPAAIAGYPAITIPAGYLSSTGVPFGIGILGTKGSEPTLIEIAFDLEQATLVRKPPPSM
ncbi:hypothetical protein SELMODRAFT_172412 [Selaginella moellendorffii]|uniref:Amidase domain-containing protein n=1 Tax=Selaginella moellendorffii TaxID=88036 RepID=D8RLK4_SELML|nr:probable amidase At4g34880 [Selaginella moellendorffii]EFJ26936.1 hypothetical protein SELMODRAFT_172412 [Selaginella moellendorffii]|eukprot:XP_002972019.1 probable amidase At4g34880 [Selaginella moellendorffii]